MGIHVTDSDWSIVTNNTYVFYARYNESTFDSYCSRRLLFGYGGVNANGSISWQHEQTVRSPNQTLAFPNEVVRVDANNQVWIGYQEDSHCGGTGIQIPRIVHSSGTNYSIWTGDTVLSTAHSRNWDVDIATLSGGEVYAAYWINTLDIHGRIFNGTAWSADEQISSPTDATDVNSFVFASGNTVYAIWHDSNSGMLRFAARSATGTWSISDIGPGEVKSNGSRYSLPITATFNPSSSKFYIYWYNATRQAIDQWAGSANNWTMTPSVFTTGQALGEYTITSYYKTATVGTNSTFGVMWVDQVSAPYQLNFGLVVSPTPTPPPGLYFDYILTIMLENEGLNDTYGSHCRGNCTYITKLADTYGLSLQYSSIGHPSLPNYLGLTSGGNYDSIPFDEDCYPQFSGCVIPAHNMVDSLESAGLTWKAYMEDYGGGCSLARGSNDYINSHNPFVYYSDIYGNATRCNRIVDANPGGSGYLALPTQLLSDLGSTANASNYMWLSPNLCDDGHDTCAPLNNFVSQQNQYLSILVPKILNSTIFRTQRAALLITWDESTTMANNIVTTIWAGTIARLGYQSSIPYSVYSAAKTVETNWGLPTLTTYDSSAQPMTEFLATSTSVGGYAIPVDTLALTLPLLLTPVILVVGLIPLYTRPRNCERPSPRRESPKGRKP